jgi:hypothetical protein
MSKYKKRNDENTYIEGCDIGMPITGRMCDVKIGHNYLFLNKFTDAAGTAIGAFPFRLRDTGQDVLIESQAFGVNCNRKKFY